MDINRTFTSMSPYHSQNITKVHIYAIAIPNAISKVIQPNHGKHHLTPRYTLSAGELGT